MGEWRPPPLAGVKIGGGSGQWIGLGFWEGGLYIHAGVTEAELLGLMGRLLVAKIAVAGPVWVPVGVPRGETNPRPRPANISGPRPDAPAGTK